LLYSVDEVNLYKEPDDNIATFCDEISKTLAMYSRLALCYDLCSEISSVCILFSGSRKYVLAFGLLFYQDNHSKNAGLF